MEILNRRAECVLAIGEIKRDLGMPARDVRREAKVLARLTRDNAGPFPEVTIRTLFEQIFEASLELMGERGGPTLQIASGPRRTVDVRGRTIGADPVYIAGPCSIESEAQLDETAASLARLGVGFLRGGAFKPRTSPYTFRGLGEPALKILQAVGERYDLITVTEVTSTRLARLVAGYADVLQIGARNMYNYDLLRAVAATGKPVLLKRSFSATIDEWLLAAEHLALAGCEDIILCERGIRTFETATRNTLDVSAVPLALARCKLPVIVDVSHAAGRRDLLAPLACAGLAAGAHGVMVEVHPDPDNALSDAAQQLSIPDFEELRLSIRAGLEGVAESCRALNEERGGRACDSAWRATSTTG